MSEFKGTSGIWGNNGNHVQVDPNDPMKTQSICMMYGSGEEKEANQRLISCAPEMLEMLKEAREAVLTLLEHEEGWEDTFTNIDELIQKATTI